MSFRVVEESPTIKTAADAERFVYFDSGCVVFPTGETRRIEAGWEVGCYSNDGRPRALDRPDIQRAASSLADLPATDDASIESVGWQPYSNPAPDAGKERKGK